MLNALVRKMEMKASALTVFALFISVFATAQVPKDMVSVEKPREFKDVGIVEKLGTHLNLDEQVRNEKGEMVPLRTYFTDDQPVVFSLIYYNCPGLCNFHMNGLTDGLKGVDWSPGQKFKVVAMSFDAKEGAELAQAKKASYMKVYNRPGTENGWHFLTADEATIKRITESVGFQFRWDEQQKQWAHASAAIMVTPEGKIARYLHGIMFDPSTLKLALNEAGKGQVGNVIDQMIWYCFHYDPKQSKYTLYAFRLVQLGAGLIVLLLGVVLVPAWARARREQA